MSSSRIIGILVGLWLAIVGIYALVSVAQGGHPQAVSTFGNIVQCIVPLLANAGLLLNAGTPHWRRNIFWMLLAMSCTLWMIGQFEWTYYEVYQHQPMPIINTGDIIFFLKGIPIMAALALQPHRKRGELRLQVGYLNFVLLFTWWAFVYAFVVFPWMYATPSEAQYNYNYDVVTNVQNMVIVIGLGVLWLRAKGAWRVVYANLFGGAAMYMLSSLTINVAISMHKYSTGSAYDLPLISSFLWFGLAGVIAYLNRTDLDSLQDNGSDSEDKPRESMWSARLAMAAVISYAVFAIVTLRFAHDAPAVRDFRLMTTLIASVPIAFLVFLRTHLADADRARLLARSEQSVENLQRLQAQMVQTEKLVSLGQLAAGAAHEINNPLAAILGFSDLLADDPTLPEKARVMAGKIRDQARRTKTLVANLLRFARQVPPERTLLDINTVVTNAVQLRALDLRSATTRVELQLESVLPGVRGDGNQLMQVFFNIISNALDAMEAANGGVLTIKTIRDRSNVVVLFSDNGFGIIQEHAGRILCYNHQGGGAVFRVELPAVLAAFPAKDLQLTSTSANSAKPS